MNTENNLLQTREEEGGTFERTLVASEFIDWLLQEGEMATREEAEQLGRRLLEHGIIQHGEEDGGKSSYQYHLISTRLWWFNIFTPSQVFQNVITFCCVCLNLLQLRGTALHSSSLARRPFHLQHCVTSALLFWVMQSDKCRSLIVQLQPYLHT